MPYEIRGTDGFAEWYGELTAEQQEAVNARIELLEREGPHLHNPRLVKVIETSRHRPRMKELRTSADGALRILFIFDPRREAMLLIGGDKTGQWETRYAENVPWADARYEAYLKELRESGEVSP